MIPPATLKLNIYFPGFLKLNHSQAIKNIIKMLLKY